LGISSGCNGNFVIGFPELLAERRWQEDFRKALGR
jgi:hypothetical protein